MNRYTVTIEVVVEAEDVADALDVAKCAIEVEYLPWRVQDASGVTTEIVSSW